MVRLVVQALLLNGIKNSKNRKAPLRKAVKAVEEEIKQAPDAFLSKPQILKYREWMRTQDSVVLQEGMISKEDGSEPAAPILINIIKAKGSLPTISNVVDSMNLVSVKYGLALSAWDAQRLTPMAGEAHPRVTYRPAVKDTPYQPFMSARTVSLLEGELIGLDGSKRCCCLVRYRDSQLAPVLPTSSDVMIHIQLIDPDDQDLETLKLATDELKNLLETSVGGNLLFTDVEHFKF